METLNRYLYSVDPKCHSLFLRELEDEPEARLLARVDEKTYLLEAPGNFHPLFAQHRFLIQGEFRTEGDDLHQLVESGPSLALPETGTFAFQLRANLRMPWSFGALVSAWSHKMGWSRERRDNRSPDWVFSAYLWKQEQKLRIFYGLAPVGDNLSPWSGGECRIPMSKSAISRAEQKLREALELIALDQGQPLEGEGHMALDLGAAPGGWTKVALEAGFQVLAVDPADLDSRVENSAKVTHFATTSGDFLTRSEGRYHLLLCDMKMEPALACRTVAEALPGLAEQGFLVMTLKLPKGEAALNQAREAIRFWEGRLRLIQARKLYFNRHEVTVIAQKEEAGQS